MVPQVQILSNHIVPQKPDHSVEGCIGIPSGTLSKSLGTVQILTCGTISRVYEITRLRCIQLYGTYMDLLVLVRLVILSRLFVLIWNLFQNLRNLILHRSFSLKQKTSTSISLQNKIENKSHFIISFSYIYKMYIFNKITTINWFWFLKVFF